MGAKKKSNDAAVAQTSAEVAAAMATIKGGFRMVVAAPSDWYLNAIQENEAMPEIAKYSDRLVGIEKSTDYGYTLDRVCARAEVVERLPNAFGHIKEKEMSVLGRVAIACTKGVAMGNEARTTVDIVIPVSLKNWALAKVKAYAKTNNITMDGHGRVVVINDNHAMGALRPHVEKALEGMLDGKRVHISVATSTGSGTGASKITTAAAGRLA